MYIMGRDTEKHFDEFARTGSGESRSKFLSSMSSVDGDVKVEKS